MAAHRPANPAPSTTIRAMSVDCISQESDDEATNDQAV
jgi:hypothetical protein